MMRMIVAESRLADGVFAAPYDEAAFSEVVGRTIGSVAAFGEGIIHGRRCVKTVAQTTGLLQDSAASAASKAVSGFLTIPESKQKHGRKQMYGPMLRKPFSA